MNNTSNSMMSSWRRLLQALKIRPIKNKVEKGSENVKNEKNQVTNAVSNAASNQIGLLNEPKFRTLKWSLEINRYLKDGSRAESMERWKANAKVDDKAKEWSNIEKRFVHDYTQLLLNIKEKRRLTIDWRATGGYTNKELIKLTAKRVGLAAPELGSDDDTLNNNNSNNSKSS